MSTRFCSRRRSVSSWVSPGPRRPMARRRAGARGGSSRGPGGWPCGDCCASSTCSLPSWLRARWAKMSRISPVRSTDTAAQDLQGCAPAPASARGSPAPGRRRWLAGGLHLVQLAGPDQGGRAGFVDPRSAPRWRSRARPSARVPPNSSSTPSPAARRHGAGSAARSRAARAFEQMGRHRANCDAAPAAEHRSIRRPHPAGPRRPPAIPIRTLRAGTTVEMVRLQTIWLTGAHAAGPMNWSNDSMVPCKS